MQSWKKYLVTALIGGIIAVGISLPVILSASSYGVKVSFWRWAPSQALSGFIITLAAQYLTGWVIKDEKD